MYRKWAEFHNQFKYVNSNHNVPCTNTPKYVCTSNRERVVFFLYLNNYISGNNQTYQPNRINREKTSFFPHKKATQESKLQFEQSSNKYVGMWRMVYEMEPWILNMVGKKFL